MSKIIPTANALPFQKKCIYPESRKKGLFNGSCDLCCISTGWLVKQRLWRTQRWVLNSIQIDLQMHNNCFGYFEGDYCSKQLVLPNTCDKIKFWLTVSAIILIEIYIYIYCKAKVR